MKPDGNIPAEINIEAETALLMVETFTSPP